MSTARSRRYTVQQGRDVFFVSRWGSGAVKVRNKLPEQRVLPAAHMNPLRGRIGFRDAFVSAHLKVDITDTDDGGVTIIAPVESDLLEPLKIGWVLDLFAYQVLCGLLLVHVHCNAGRNMATASAAAGEDVMSMSREATHCTINAAA